MLGLLQFVCFPKGLSHSYDLSGRSSFARCPRFFNQNVARTWGPVVPVNPSPEQQTVATLIPSLLTPQSDQLNTNVTDSAF